MNGARPWHLGRLCAFDVETTGVDTGEDRIVTAHIAAVGGGQPVISRSWVINSGVPIPAEATAIHGITDEHVRVNGEPASVAVNAIAAALASNLANGTPIVVYNAPFDLTMLRAELDRHGMPSLEDRIGREVRPVIDPLVIDKALDRYRKGSRKLIDVAAHYGIRLDEADAHGAAADAMTAARVAYMIGARSTELQAMTLDALHDWQIEKAIEQQESLEQWFRRTRPDAVVERGWPHRGAGVAA